jgi:Transposase DDE domain
MGSPSPTEAATGGVLDEVEQVLREAIEGLAPDRREAERAGPGRPRVLPSLCLWGGLLVCVLRGFSSQLDLWRRLTWQGLWEHPRFPLSDQAVYRRLGQAGTAPLETLFAQISALSAARIAPYVSTDLAPFAHRVVAIDETTLDPVARTLPALRGLPAADTRRLPGKLAAIFDLRAQQWVHLEHRAYARENDKVAARGLLAHLEAGALILADLGYFGFAWFDDLTDAGFWWVSRLRARTSYTVLHAFYDDGATFDGLVFLGAHRADRAKHAVRLVRFRVGQTTYQYLTNVRAPTTLPLVEVARLYARRWDIELAFKLAKREPGLHLLWSAKTPVVLQQVWAVLIIAQIFQALRLEIAARAGVDLFDVSLPLLIRYLPQFARDGRDPIAVIVATGGGAGLFRPARRVRIQAPALAPDRLIPAPPDLGLVRTPRYANKDCGPRSPKLAIRGN